MIFNSTEFRLFDIEYDSTTEDFFFMGHVTYASSGKHFLSRMNKIGNLEWGKVYNTDFIHHGMSSHYTLKYSPTYETLYFTLTQNDNFVLMRVNSTDGSDLESYVIVQNEELYTYFRCSLSDDESSLF